MRIRDFDPEAPASSVAYERQPVKDEWQLESWLHRNPGLLLDEPILIIGRQFDTSVGSPDLVGLDRYGNVVVFELKAGQSGTKSATEQSILGQPQSYARALGELDYNDLAGAYRDYRSEVMDGTWDGVELPATDESLNAVFETWAERSLEREQFNTNQRMVIVAEQITRTTEQNTRYLVEEGLAMQCVEVHYRKHPDDPSDAVLAATTVVDYPLQRIKPEHESDEEFQNLLETVRDRIKNELNEHSSPVPSDYVTKTPRHHLEFSDKSLFDDLNIKYVVKPDTDGSVTVSLELDYYGEDGEAEKDAVRSVIREQTDIPDDETYNFDAESSIVVKQRLPLHRDAGKVTDDSLSEIVDAFVELIERTYPILERSLTEA